MIHKRQKWVKYYLETSVFDQKWHEGNLAARINFWTVVFEIFGRVGYFLKYFFRIRGIIRPYGSCHMTHVKWTISTLTLSKVNLLDLTFPQVLVKRTTGVKLRPSAIAIAEFQFPWWQHSIATSIRWSITFAAFEVFDARHTWLAVKAERELNLNFNVISGHFGSRSTDMDKKFIKTHQSAQ